MVCKHMGFADGVNSTHMSMQPQVNKLDHAHKRRERSKVAIIGYIIVSTTSKKYECSTA